MFELGKQKRWERAFVTGAGSGIGRELARQLAATGAELAVFDLQFDDAARTAILDARVESGQRVVFHTADVTDAPALRAAVDAAAGEIGAPQLAINSAGINIARMFHQLSDEEYRRVVEVNLLGSRNAAYALLRAMGKGSRLVLIASFAGIAANWAYSAYGASKSGVIGLAEVLRLECRPLKIGVSVVCPPEVPTPMVEVELADMHPAQRALKALAGQVSIQGAAAAILRGAGRGRFLVIPGAKARLLYWAQKLLPLTVTHALSDRVVRQTLAAQPGSAPDWHEAAEARRVEVMEHRDAPTICQVAFCQLEAPSLRRWYREGFGLLASGRILFAGPPAAQVNGLPWPLFPGRWLVDSQGLFQLEFFRFLHPRPMPRRADEAVTDHGYRVVGITTADLAGTLTRLDAGGGRRQGPTVGEVGARRVGLRDPEGNLVEVCEDDPLAAHAPPPQRPEVPATVRFVTLPVPELDGALRDWRDGLGLVQLADDALHGPEHTGLWGQVEVPARRAVVVGGGVAIELVEYSAPTGRPRQAGYRICDQGLMNVALGVLSRAAFDRAFARLVDHGCRPMSPTPLDVGIFRVMYFDLPSGPNVELLYPRRWARGITGFRAGGLLGEP